MGATVVFDQGQTGIRLAVLPLEDEEVLLLGGRDRSESPAEMVERLGRIAHSQMGLAQIGRMVGGSTGLFGARVDLSRAVKVLGQVVGTNEIVLADDAVTGYLGSLGNEPGVVLIAGTGNVALGTDGHGNWSRVEGRGAMLGDEGSGWWIGREGLVAAFRCIDGRAGGSQALVDEAIVWGGSLEAIPSAISHDRAPMALVAQFAEHVAQAALRGDVIAQDIWNRAGKLLGSSIAAVANRLNLPEGYTYALTGGVSNAGELLNSLDRTLANTIQHPRKASPHGSPLTGAALLSQMPPAVLDRFGDLITRVTR